MAFFELVMQHGYLLTLIIMTIRFIFHGIFMEMSHLQNINQSQAKVSVKIAIDAPSRGVYLLYTLYLN